MTDDVQHVAVDLFGGVLTASITTLLAPALRQRWKRQDSGENQKATVEVAKIEASEKFQDRLMERIRDLEQRNNGLCESVAKLANSVDHLATVLAAASEKTSEPGAVARD